MVLDAWVTVFAKKGKLGIQRPDTAIGRVDPFYLRYTISRGIPWSPRKEKNIPGRIQGYHHEETGAAERIRVDETVGKGSRKVRRDWTSVESWQTCRRDRRKKGDRWVGSGVCRGDFTPRKAVQVVVRLEAGQMHLTFYQTPQNTSSYLLLLF